MVIEVNANIKNVDVYGTKIQPKKAYDPKNPNQPTSQSHNSIILAKLEKAI